MKYALFVATFFISAAAFAQNPILGISTSYNDSFREWNIAVEGDDRAGELRLRWPFREDWREWEFRLGDTTALIKQKWPDNPELWEIQALGETVTAQTSWRRDLKSWRLTDGQHTLTLKTKYSNSAAEWILRDESNGFFSIYQYYEGDPRDWVLIDELGEDVSFSMRIALIFIAIYHSSPRQ